MKDLKSKTLALAHTSAEHINRCLPMQIVDSLLTECKAKDFDIEVYVSPSASLSSYTYKDYPKWATNETLWKNCIYFKNGLYYIDLKKFEF